MQWYVIKSLGLYVGHCAREWSGKHMDLVKEMADARHFPSYASAQEHLQQFKYENGEIMPVPAKVRPMHYTINKLLLIGAAFGC